MYMGKRERASQATDLRPLASITITIPAHAYEDETSRNLAIDIRQYLCLSDRSCLGMTAIITKTSRARNSRRRGPSADQWHGKAVTLPVKRVSCDCTTCQTRLQPRIQQYASEKCHDQSQQAPCAMHRSTMSYLTAQCATAMMTCQSHASTSISARGNSPFGGVLLAALADQRHRAATALRVSAVFDWVQLGWRIIALACSESDDAAVE